MIHHVALETRRADVDACVAFWGLLGFSPVPPPPALAGRTTWVQRGGTQVHLLYAEAPVRAPEGHVAVAVEDYDAALERLRGAGHPVQERGEHWGSPRCFTRTPDGHRVEVMAFAPS